MVILLDERNEERQMRREGIKREIWGEMTSNFPHKGAFRDTNKQRHSAGQAGVKTIMYLDTRSEYRRHLLLIFKRNNIL